MDYKELIDELRHQAKFTTERMGDDNGKRALENAATAIETLLKTTRWISIDEYLPEPDVDVLMLFEKSGSMAVGSRVYKDDTEHWTCNVCGGCYTYSYSTPDFWMPLPNKPNK